jgi:predicted Zn finger-like uncharacterized protein
MSLATRCPACGTAFRVVQDQLKVSGGWVRCGQCHQVFNGLESLHELSTPPATAPSAAAPRQAAPTPRPAPVRPSSAPAPAALTPPPDTRPATELDLSDPEWRDPEPTAAPAATPAEDTGPIPTGFALESDTGWSAFDRAEPAPPHEPEPEPAYDPVLRGVRLPPGEHGGLSTFGAVARASRAPAPPIEPGPSTQPSTFEALPSPSALDEEPSGPAPAFMRRAERAARWRHPAVRTLLAVTAAGLALGLALQVAHQQRDLLAARWPALVPALQAWCEAADCTLEPPRLLAQLAIDSSSLQRTDLPQVLRFEAEVRNAASHPVRAPALEVTLTDPQGRLVARKVLLPQELGAPDQGIAPEGSWHASARLRVGELAVTGFSAEVFYP